MAADIFAKIGDIKGESLDDKHKDEVEILTFSWGLSNGSGTLGTGTAVGKTTFHDLSIVHKTDKASPALMAACATGKHFKEATITHRKAGKTQHEYLIFKLSDVIVTGVTQSGSGGELPAETVSLSFAKVDVEYRPQKPDGSVDAGLHFKYDLLANKVG